jgi:hypothetical protein
MSVRWIYLPFALGGSAYILYFLRNAMRGFVSNKWPTTVGQVNTSHLSTERYMDGPLSYTPEFGYEYIVAKEKYSSKRIGFLNDYSSSFFFGKSGAESIINRNPIGTKIIVYYHPNKPQLSVLVPGFRPSTIHGFLILFILVFIVALLISFL